MGSVADVGLKVLVEIGLARYPQARLPARRRSLTACASLADNGDILVAAVYWQALSLHRAGRAGEAKRAIAAVPTGLEVIENEDYGRLLRLLSGEAKLDDLAPAAAGGGMPSGGVPGATVGYGIGAWHLIGGRTAEARRAFEQVVAGNTWAAFGHLASEAELARGR